MAESKDFVKSFQDKTDLNGQNSQETGVRRVIEEITTRKVTIIGNEPTESDDSNSKTVQTCISKYEDLLGNSNGNSVSTSTKGATGERGFVFPERNGNSDISGNKAPPAGWKPNITQNVLNKDDDSDVQYESEEEYTYTPPGKKRQNSPGPSRSFHQTQKNSVPMSTEAGGSRSHASSITAAVNGSHSKSVTIEQLTKLGEFLKLDRDVAEFKLIKEYAKNSHGLSHHGSLTIHDIYQRNSKKKEHTKYSGKSSKPSHAQSDYKMLLWCKTTPEIIRKLSEDSDSCMAFYDRMARAYPKPASKMGNTRLILMLCVVNLGNVYKSKHGYDHWKKNSVSHGFESVKGGGLYSPNWHDNRLYEKVIVPCGETQKNTRFPKYEIEYNEYMVYKAKKIEPLFAVDIEISSK